MKSRTCGLYLALLIQVAIPQSAPSEVLLGGQLEGAWVKTQSKSKEDLDRSGTAMGLAGGLLFPVSDDAVMSTLIGLRTFDLSGTSNRRRQLLQTFGGTLRVDYRWIMGSFEPGLLLNLDQGPGTTLKLAEKNELTSMLSIGPELAYRWRTESNHIVGFVATTLDVNVAQQNNFMVLTGLQLWFKTTQTPMAHPPRENEPETAESKPAVQEKSSAPEPPSPEVPDQIVMTSLRFKSDVFQFELGKAQLTRSSQTKAKAVAETLHSFVGSWSHIDIEGHTDAKGDPATNQRLSEDRAQSIRTFFINHGIPESSLSAKGYGAERPLLGIAPDASENRRVELQFHNLQNAEALGKALDEFVVLEKERQP